MSDPRNKEMDKEIVDFMNCHGMAECSDCYNYHMSLGFYCAYSVDAFRFAEMVECGEAFDEFEVSAAIKNLRAAHKTLRYFQSRLPFRLSRFDMAETVKMKGCRLERGQIVGDGDQAVATARKWLSRFCRHGKQKYEKKPCEKGELSISQDFFLYEVAVFLLYLTEEEVDYGFLEP